MVDSDGVVHFGRRPDSLRVPVPRKLERELADINRRLEEDARRKEEIVVELLRLGCFQRDIGDAAGLTKARVGQIGKKHGWPPPDLEQKRREMREKTIAERAQLREDIANLPEWLRRRDED